MPPEQHSLFHADFSGVSRWMLFIVLLAAAVLAVIVLIVWSTMRPPVASSAPFSGSLALGVAAPWKAPSGETISGFVDYVPNTGGVSNLFMPNAELAMLTSGTSLSPDGTHGLATRTSSSTTELVTVSRTSQSVDKTIASAVTGTVFAAPLWAPDGSRIAYLQIPSLQHLPLAPDKKSYFVTVGTTTTLRAGLTLPAAYQPQTKVARVDGGGTINVTGIPVAFSADGTRLLTTGQSTFFMTSTKDGKETPVSGTLVMSNIKTLKTSPDGDHIAVLAKDGNLTLYAIDWTKNTLSSIGTLSGVSQTVFGPDGTLLTLNASGAHAYNPSSGTPSLTASYAFTLPDSVQVLSWLPQ